MASKPTLSSAEAEQRYLELNKDHWDKRVEPHVKSSFYDVKGFLAGESSLQEPELALLGDIKGKRILHLQCHFGMDTISLARCGAEKVVGVDFSSKAISQAKKLADTLKIDTNEVDFVECDIYSLPENLNNEEKFDIVFTSYGTIGWLPDMVKFIVGLCFLINLTPLIRQNGLK
eukprot:m.12982 g.12982  ORF g.12982 m.12982 type:complete len:174 (+) comp4764_c0_seq1:103-624(+)